MKPLLLALLCLCPTVVHAQETGAPAVRVEGNVSHPLTLTNTSLRQQFASSLETVKYNLKGEKAQAHCVSLLAVVQAAGLDVDPHRKNAQLSYAVLVTAEDGYAITFSMGELLGDYGKARVWVAIDKNDKPLAQDDAPADLLVPDDKKPSRWVHGIRSIRIVSLAPGTAK